MTSPLPSIRGLRVFGWVALLVGAAALTAAMAMRRWDWVFGALASGWLLCTGMAAGAVALFASVRVAQGKWASELTPAAEAATGFFAPSLGLLAVLTVSGPLWISGIKPAAAWWLFPVRELVATSVLFWLGRRALRQQQGFNRSIVYLLAYAVVLSLWATDFVLALRQGSASTAVPAFYFMGALLSGLAWAALTSTLRPGGVPVDVRHDSGKLIFALATFWAYLLWAIFLPTWYANIPEETSQLLAEVRGVYRGVAWAMGAGVLALPFLLLLLEGGKRNLTVLRVSAVSVLGGLTLERFLMVLPALDAEPSLLSIGLCVAIELGVLGVFVLAAAPRYAAAQAPPLMSPAAGS